MMMYGISLSDGMAVEKNQASVHFEVIFLISSVALTVLFYFQWQSWKGSKWAKVYQYIGAVLFVGILVGFAGVILVASQVLTNFYVVQILFLLVAVAFAIRQGLRLPEYLHANALAEYMPDNTEDPGETMRSIPAGGEPVAKIKPSDTFGKRSRYLVVLASSLVTGCVFGFFGLFFVSDMSSDGIDLLPAKFFSLFGLFAGFILSWMVFISGAASKQKLNEALDKIAAHVGGKVEHRENPQDGFSYVINFQHKGAAARFDAELRGNDKSRRYHLFIEFRIMDSVPTLDIRPYSIWKRRDKIDIELGWNLFDDMFVIHLEDHNSNTMATLRKVLTREVQESLLKLQLWNHGTPGNDDIELSVFMDSGQTYLRIYGISHFTDPAVSTRFYDFCGEVYDSMIAQPQR